MYSELEVHLRQLLLFAAEFHPYFASTGKQTDSNLHKIVVSLRSNLGRQILY